MQLVQGETREVLGLRLTYDGPHYDSRGAQVARIQVRRGTWTMNAEPRMMPSPRGDGMMHMPAIDLAHDLYVSPVQMGDMRTTSGADDEPVWLDRNTPTPVGGATYVFRGFRMEHTGEQYLANADVDVTVAGHTTRVSPALRASARGTEPVAANVPGLGALTLARMDADHGRIALLPPAAAEVAPMVVVDMSTRPLVNLVWAGALFMLLGSGLAGVRRAREQVVHERRGAAARAQAPVEVTPKPV